MKSIWGLSALFLSSLASATGTSGVGVPSFLTYGNNGIVFVYVLSTDRTGWPPCAGSQSGTYNKYAFDAKAPGGAALLAGLIAAHEAGEVVWANGTGDCGVDSGTESLLKFGTNNS
jgi:hypothetical protein